VNGIGNYGRRRDLSWTIAIMVTVLLVAFFGWLVLRSPDDSGQTLLTQPSTPVATAEASVVPVTLASTDSAPAVEVGVNPTPDDSVAPLPTDSASSDAISSDATTTQSTEPLAVPATTLTPNPISPSLTAPAGPSYPTLPDGSPVPVLGVYNGDSVAVSGNVPSQAAKDRLLGLAVANSQSLDPVLTDFVTINPDVPIGIGVRVIDAASERFPDGDAEIRPAHAAQLDRALAIMNLFPEVKVLIIGHSDQRGSEEQNFEISRDRAQAVNDYFVAGGVSPLRISSRAVGEADLLTENDDAASLALNRRTEFVFYGLLTE